MLRTSASRCICMAVLGKSSEIRTPGTVVSIDRNGPPVSVLGLGSQVSSWLAPPASQTTSTCRCFLASSAAIDGAVNPANPAPKPGRHSHRETLDATTRARANCRRMSSSWGAPCSRVAVLVAGGEWRVASGERRAASGERRAKEANRVVCFAVLHLLATRHSPPLAAARHSSLND